MLDAGSHECPTMDVMVGTVRVPIGPVIVVRRERLTPCPEVMVAVLPVRPVILDVAPSVARLVMKRGAPFHQSRRSREKPPAPSLDKGLHVGSAQIRLRHVFQGRSNPRSARPTRARKPSGRPEEGFVTVSASLVAYVAACGLRAKPPSSPAGRHRVEAAPALAAAAACGPF